MSLLELIAVNFAVTAALTFLVWLGSVKLRDVSIVDVFWGPGFVVIAWISFFLTDEITGRKVLLGLGTTALGLPGLAEVQHPGGLSLSRHA